MLTTKPKKNGANVEIKPAWSEAPQNFQGVVLLHKIEIDFGLAECSVKFSSYVTSKVQVILEASGKTEHPPVIPI